jgi:hypothetical protein
MMKMLYVTEPATNEALLDFFIDQVQAVNEFDYGDCMREWNRELLYLWHHFRNPPSWLDETFQEMQGYIQFYPNWDVESTRQQILEDAKHLREELSPPNPPAPAGP